MPFHLILKGLALCEILPFVVKNLPFVYEIGQKKE